MCEREGSELRIETGGEELQKKQKKEKKRQRKKERHSCFETCLDPARSDQKRIGDEDSSSREGKEKSKGREARRPCCSMVGPDRRQGKERCLQPIRRDLCMDTHVSFFPFCAVPSFLSLSLSLTFSQRTTPIALHRHRHRFRFRHRSSHGQGPSQD